MRVIFVEPGFPSNQREFVRALHSVGAEVIGIGEAPFDGLDRELQGFMAAYEQVSSVVHVPALLEAVRRCQARAWIDRIEATIEAHILPVAKVREEATIPGTSYRTAFLCRDKPAMKQALREAGIPCAQSTGVSSMGEAYDFVERTGFPLIVKPRDGAGAAGTYRVNSRDDLDSALRACHVPEGASVALEEFIEGHEAFYDTITVGGEVMHDFISHYYPGVLEAMRTRWISPQIISTNRVDADSYEEVKELGKRVIEVLGIETSATHMEWFYGPRGLSFSEIGCRPPGVGAWDLYSAGNEFDLYKEWASAIVHGGPHAQPSRRFAAGMIALRPDQDGTIEGYEGLAQIEQKYDRWIIDGRFPPVGTATQPIEGGYWANAYMRVKHPDYDTLREILNDIGESVQVRARPAT